MRGPNSTRGTDARHRPRLEIASTPAAIDQARVWVRRECGTRLRVQERWIDEFELAMVEAVANVIEHAYGGATDRSILLELSFATAAVDLLVHDDGRAFPGVDFPPPLPPVTAEGGRGLFLMHALTDRVRHTRDAAGRNCVCLTKNT